MLLPGLLLHRGLFRFDAGNAALDVLDLAAILEELYYVLFESCPGAIFAQRLVLHISLLDGNHILRYNAWWKFKENDRSFDTDLSLDDCRLAGNAAEGNGRHLHSSADYTGNTRILRVTGRA